MISCPSCKTKGLSRVKLFLQELTIPGVKAHCENCGAHYGIKEESFFAFIWVEVLFFLVIIVSVIYLNVWAGFAVFIIWSMVRVIIKTNGELTNYETDL